MLTNKQKKYLRQIGHALTPIFQIGKDGVSANQIEGINQALEAHELIKVKVLENCMSDKGEVFAEIALRTQSEIVHTIGKTALLYRQSQESVITLP